MTQVQDAEDAAYPRRTLEVEVVALAAPVWSGKARFVSAPTPGGSIGIYPRHQPLLSVLAPGKVEIERVGLQHHDAFGPPRIEVQASGGFISVDSDHVTIVSDECTVLTKKA
ncbi:MAG: hypothetical protein LBM66_01240 [Bifidobacteriaceae bacterium]|jgi:F-type H+-transporting ATPase subunit epsilon|nr:hypothetical protein [Bifidobacteriaceae bacterium]